MKPSVAVHEVVIAHGADRVCERLHRDVTTDSRGCLVRAGSTYNGYTRLRFGKTANGGPSILAHRVAWALANNADPGEMLVCHTCDNRRCVNPEHLWLGTPLDNTRDMDAKGHCLGRGKSKRVFHSSPNNGTER